MKNRVARLSWSLAGLACAAVLATSGAQVSAARRQPPPRVDQRFGRLREGFEANLGQASARHFYLLRDDLGGFALGAGGALTTTGSGAAYLPQRKRHATQLRPVKQRLPSLPVAGVTITPLGGNTKVRPSAEETLPGRVHHIEGKGGWRTGLSRYGRVRFPQIYPGIDLAYYTRQGALEYDFEVQAGADPRRIILGVSGADDLRLASNGDLLISTFGQVMRQRRPRIYQPAGRARLPVSGGYVLLDGYRVAIRVGAYNRNQPLVIDPVIESSAGVGGEAVAVDADGNTIVCGSTYFGDIYEDNYLPPHAFVRKLDPTGELVFTTYLAGSGSEQAFDVAVDPAGNIYVTGITNSLDFPVLSPIQGSLGSTGAPEYDQDAFVTKLLPSGELAYSTYVGGAAGPEWGYAISAGPDGSAYVAGETTSVDFPVANAVQPTLRVYPGTTLGSDAFALRINPAGSGFVFSTFYGGDLQEHANDVAVGLDGDLYMGGFTESSDLPLANPIQSVIWPIPDVYYGYPQDGFIARISASGSSLIYATYLGGGGEDEVQSICVDDQGGIFAVGRTRAWDFPTANALQPQLGTADPNHAPADAFIVRLIPDGSAAVYSTYLGGTEEEQCTGIAVDATGFAFLSGTTSSQDFPLVNPWQPAMGGLYQDYNAFAACVTPTGSALEFSSYQGSSNTAGVGVALTGGGVALVATVSDMEFPILKYDSPSLTSRAPGASVGRRCELQRIRRRGGRGRFPSPGQPGFPTPIPGHQMYRGTAPVN